MTISACNDNLMDELWSALADAADGEPAEADAVRFLDLSDATAGVEFELPDTLRAQLVATLHAP